MIKFPLILAAFAILGINFAQILPDKFSEFSAAALITLIALAVLVISDRRDNRTSALTDSINALVKELQKKPCMLDKDALKEIFSQEV